MTSSSSWSRAIARPTAASRTSSFVHQVKSRIVAGPWLRKKRRTNSPSASSRSSCAGIGHPLVHQHHRLMNPVHRPEAQRAVLVQPAQEVRSPLAGRGDAVLLEELEQLGPGQGTSALEDADRDLAGALEGCVVEIRVRDTAWSSDCSVRVAVSSSIQPMSCAATRCSVPRIGQERMTEPSASAASTSARVVPGARSPTDHLAPARSCACIASIQRTTSAGAGELAALDALGSQSQPCGSSSRSSICGHRCLPHRQSPSTGATGARNTARPPDAGGIGRPWWTIPGQCASRHVVALGD